MSNINNDNQKELELENNLEELKKKLSVHDYYYDYADDHDSYTKGLAEMKEIRALITLCGRHGDDLYEEYVTLVNAGKLSVDGLKEWQ